jgi:hypothetical protein
VRGGRPAPAGPKRGVEGSSVDGRNLLVFVPAKDKTTPTRDAQPQFTLFLSLFFVSAVAVRRRIISSLATGRPQRRGLSPSERGRRRLERLGERGTHVEPPRFAPACRLLLQNGKRLDGRGRGADASQSDCEVGLTWAGYYFELYF